MYKNLQHYVSINGHNKVKWYFPVYDSTISKLFNKHVRILEIGVAKGQSMKMWKECFPLAEIVGLDIDPGCKRYEEDRVSIVIGDQRDENLLKSLGEFDIIIDDGGHGPDEQQKSFEILYPVLADGGWYFIEDVHGGYSSQLIEGKLSLTIQRARFDLTTQVLFKDLMDCTLCPHVFTKYNVSEMRLVNGFIGLRKLGGDK